MRKIFIVRNKNSGQANYAVVDHEIRKLHQHFQVAEFTIKEVLNNKFLERCHKEKPAYVVAIGGDGTVNACATIAAQCDIRLVVIPDGTFNHFAKHTGLPIDIKKSFALISDGRTEEIDIGLINSKDEQMYFVNFISMGIYADAVALREIYDERGYKKLYRFIIALASTVFKNKKIKLSYSVGDKGCKIETPLLFIGNNKFVLGSFDVLAERENFQSGKLHVMFMKDYGRVALVTVAIMSLFFNVSKSVGFSTVFLDEIKIDTAKQKQKVVFDGEVKRCFSPFTLSSLPRKLRLRVNK